VRAARPLRRLTVKAVAVLAALACLLGGTAHAVTGIDVSRWQHGASLNWAKVRGDGVTFAFIKATEGSFYTNSYLAGDWAGARRNGIFRGAYHFARPSRGSAAAQARYFVRQAGTFGRRGDLPPVLDLEDNGGLGVSGLRRWVRTWLRTTQELTGRKPIIYTSPYFWESRMGNAGAFRDFPLWVAHYETARPRVPGGWSHWTFWQRTDNGRIDGISGAVDINRFSGTRAQLARLAQARMADGDTGTGTDSGSGTGTTPEPGTDLPEVPTGPATPTPEAPDSPEAPEPTAAATSVTLRLDQESVFAGQQVTFAGRLRTSTGTGVRGRRVDLYRRADGSSPWSRIATLTAGIDGAFSATFAASGSADFSVSFRGGPAYAESRSRVRRLLVRPKIRTEPTLQADPSARRGRTVKVYGHLRTVAGRPVAGRTMYLYQRRPGATAWRLVARTQTLSPTGWFQAYVQQGPGAAYRAVFRGGSAFARSVTPVTVIRRR
jgi:GH25 family lysozyme M1 (1,4-beta-N-acetylmuramidase)